MVRKRDLDAPAPPRPSIPELADAVAPDDLIVPDGLDFTGYDIAAAGEPHRFGDYEVGEKIDHVDGVTLTDAEHMLATRLWQNTAKVHFNTEARDDGAGSIYGGHIIALARALSFNGLANAQLIAAINAGAHTAPAFAGDTVYAWSEVLDKAEHARPGRRCAAAAPGGHQGPRRVDDPARRRRQVRRRACCSTSTSGCSARADWSVLASLRALPRCTELLVTVAVTGRLAPPSGTTCGRRYLAAATRRRAMTLRHRVSSAPSKIDSTRASTQ